MNMEKMITPFYLMKEIKMNAFIKTDIENAVILMKAAIMNSLDSLEKGEEKEIRFENPIPLQLIIHCAEERGWEVSVLRLSNNFNNVHSVPAEVVQAMLDKFQDYPGEIKLAKVEV